MDEELKKLDRRIIELVAERSRRYMDILKERGDVSPDLLTTDISEITRLVDEENRGPVGGDCIVKFYTDLIGRTIMAGRPVSIAYLGPEGTFTHIALMEIFGESVNAVPQRTIPDVFHEVESGAADFGVVPVENSSEGAVTYTLDELLDTDLKIVSEKFLRISHSLVSICEDVTKVKKLYSHPQPLGQCKIWLRNYLPGVEVVQVNSTSKAAETASWDKFSAAIASGIAAKIYKLNVLAESIEDSRNNFTRFLVIGRKDNPATGMDKTSIVCSVKDRPGALYDMLKPFHEAGINMTKIESRPDKKKMWEYNFFIDFTGHREDAVVKKALETMGESTMYMKILGSYPVGRNTE